LAAWRFRVESRADHVDLPCRRSGPARGAATKQTVSVDDNGFSVLYGAGIQTVLDGALIRVEYQFMEIDDLTAPSAFSLHDNKMNSLNFSIVWIL
jgi:hypothetical protein